MPVIFLPERGLALSWLAIGWIHPTRRSEQAEISLPKNAGATDSRRFVCFEHTHTEHREQVRAGGA